MFGLAADEITRVNKHSTFVDIETIEKANLMDKDLIIFSPVRSNKHVMYFCSYFKSNSQIVLEKHNRKHLVYCMTLVCSIRFYGVASAVLSL